MPSRAEATLAELQSWAKRRKNSAADDSLPGSPANPGTDRRAAATQLHVDTERLDQLVSLVGELAIGRGRLARELERDSSAALEAFGETERLSQQIQDLATRLRMVNVGTVFRPLVRTVRDLAAAEGKKARISIEGADVEVDLSIVEHLRDPLMHMVRNAIDHGIETPDERMAKGKPPEGRILLQARHEAGSIVIELQDDGRGFDRQGLIRRAGELGVDTSKLGDRELIRLVLEPGFSTARAVSEISGRGVGLDVVRRNVEKLRGSIDIADRNGAHFTLRLPLTLAIIEGFGVSVGEEAFIVPLASVLECLDIRSVALEADDGSAVIDLRGKALPVIDLGTCLGVRTGAPAHHVVVVESASGRAGLAVDHLEGLHQSVIKPLGRLFAGLRNFSGSSILSDGRVALVLDVAALVERAILQHSKEKV
jgi:two-component system chemotaxis sensor kinase CheA